jgi:tetratricopeptide (TPR) repeat protein
MRSTPARKARLKRWVLRLGLAAAVIGVAAAGVLVVAVRAPNAKTPLNPDLVAVATLTNETGDATLEPMGRMAAEWISQGIQQHGVAYVVPPTLALAAAAEAREATDRVTAFAQATGAGVVLHGAYYLLGDSLQFQLQITDAVEGKLMSALAPVTGPREPATEALDLVRERVLGTLAAALDLKSAAGWIPMRPRSLEVYRVYLQGYKAEGRGDWDEADRLYREAWAMDSTLYPVLVLIAGIQAMWAGWAGGPRGDSLQAKADSLLRLADRYRDRMSEAERLFLQVQYGVQKGPEAHHRAVQRLAEHVPWYTVAAVSTAWKAYRPREALDRAARVDTANPNLAPLKGKVWRVAAPAHHMLQDYEEELEVARAARRERPENLPLLDHHLRPLAALGRIDELNTLLDTIFALPLQPSASGGGRIWLPMPDLRGRRAADELRAHGYRDAARNVLQRTIDWLEARPPEEGRQWEWFGPLRRYSLADCLYKLERWGEARVVYQELLAESPAGRVAEFPADPLSTVALANLGAVAARVGEGERARAIGEQLAGKPRGQLQLLARAKIAALLGEREEAVHLLREALQTGAWGTYMLRRHKDMDLEPLHGYPPFELFMRPRG